MSDNVGRRIGDEVYTDEGGNIRIVDVYISPTTQERVYKCKVLDAETDEFIFLESYSFER